MCVGCLDRSICLCSHHSLVDCPVLAVLSVPCLWTCSSSSYTLLYIYTRRSHAISTHRVLLALTHTHTERDNNSGSAHTQKHWHTTRGSDRYRLGKADSAASTSTTKSTTIHRSVRSLCLLVGVCVCARALLPTRTLRKNRINDRNSVQQQCHSKHYRTSRSVSAPPYRPRDKRV